MASFLTYSLILFLGTVYLAQCRVSVAPRIIGGDPASPGQFPCSVAIDVRTTNNYKHFCGGTLINNQWILTAAQCVDGAKDFTIQGGSVTLEGEDPNRVTVTANEYVIHPKYNPNTIENDLGLIKLAAPITFTQFIKNVDSLPNDHLFNNSYNDAIGWGQTVEDDPALSNHLIYVRVRAIPNIECQIIFGNQITDNFLCVGGPQNEGSCHGDTGSPLLEELGRGYLRVAAVASFLSGNGCESSDPSGYTRVFPYVDWINEVTGGLPNNLATYTNQ